jgi:hydroxymethylpyrimidine pyrophosphatase-like HAD family hydrolase
MKIEVFADADSVAREAATLIAAEARAAVAQRGRSIMAVSGGHTPWVMLRALAGEKVPWDKVHMTQVDERVAPAGHPDRNLTHLRESLLEHALLPPEQIYAMPVEAPDLPAAASQYAAILAKIAGSRSQPYYLDITHPAANKGSVVDFLSAVYLIPSSSIVTLGDMPNDVLMFKKSGMSIAMGNASKEVQAEANFVTASNEEEGFAQAIEHFVLN